MPFLDDTLPTHLGIRLTEVSAARAVGEMPIHRGVRLPSGLVHTGAMLSLGDTVATHPGRTLVIVETRVTSDTGKLLTLITTTHLIRGGAD